MAMQPDGRATAHDGVRIARWIARVVPVFALSVVLFVLLGSSPNVVSGPAAQADPDASVVRDLPSFLAYGDVVPERPPAFHDGSVSFRGEPSLLRGDVVDDDDDPAEHAGSDGAEAGKLLPPPVDRTAIDEFSRSLRRLVASAIRAPPIA